MWPGPLRTGQVEHLRGRPGRSGRPCPPTGGLRRRGGRPLSPHRWRLRRAASSASDKPAGNRGSSRYVTRHRLAGHDDARQIADRDIQALEDLLRLGRCLQVQYRCPSQPPHGQGEDASSPPMIRVLPVPGLRLPRAGARAPRCRAARRPRTQLHCHRERSRWRPSRRPRGFLLPAFPLSGW